MIDLLIRYAVAIAIYRSWWWQKSCWGAHGSGVANFVRAGTRGLRVAVRANCPV